MKVCSGCLKPFDEWQDKDCDPARELEDIFLKSIDSVNDDDLCPECREKMGMLNLMGLE
jgi:hypothetical protein